MSWTDCMKNKIIAHYGSEVKDCIQGITKDNWKEILECMVDVLGITDPEIWIPEQLILFGKWSIECEF